MGQLVHKCTFNDRNIVNNFLTFIGTKLYYKVTHYQHFYPKSLKNNAHPNSCLEQIN